MRRARREVALDIEARDWIGLSMMNRRLCWTFIAAVAAVGCGDDPPRQATFVEPVFEDPCHAFDCGGQGVCSGETGPTGPSCVCDDGYRGPHCEACDSGYHRNFEALCVPDKYCEDQTPDPCGSHGECRDDDGVISCACATGYEGPRCRLCAPGYAPHDADECLQKVISNGAATTAPAFCDPMTCSNHGQCHEDDGILACECYPGYVGSNCDQCNSGYERPAGVDQCVLIATCEAAVCGGCVVFDGEPDFPEHPDVCNSSRDIQVPGVTVWSLGGDGTTWLCSMSSRYDMPTDHVGLDAGALQPAELTFDSPIVSVSFAYVPWDDAPIEVLADGEAVTTFKAMRYVKASLKVDFKEPVSVVGLRSQDEFSHTIVVDDIVYSQDMATCN